MLIVTGGAGFIGSNLVRCLNGIGHDDIVVIDNLANADKCRNLARARFRDLIDKEDALAFLAGSPPAECIFHLGACSSTTESDGRYLLRNNVEFSKRLLALCCERRTRFIYASSASVYGDGKRGFRDDDPDCEHPLNGYAFSKWMFDCHVRRLIAEHRPAIQIVGLRYFNVYGPQEWHKRGMCSPVLHFHRQVREHGEFRLFEGSAGFTRDFVTVEDCCRVNLHAFCTPSFHGIFNCGTGQSRSFADVASCMAPHYPGARLTTVPFPEHLRGKYQAYTLADLTRLRAAGYGAPFSGLEEGIAAYVASLQGPAGGYLE